MAVEARAEPAPLDIDFLEVTPQGDRSSSMVTVSLIHAVHWQRVCYRGLHIHRGAAAELPNRRVWGAIGTRFPLPEATPI